MWKFLGNLQSGTFAGTATEAVSQRHAVSSANDTSGRFLSTQLGVVDRVAGRVGTLDVPLVVEAKEAAK